MSESPRKPEDLLPPLDDQPGPARRISQQQSRELVAQALDRAEQDPGRTRRGSRRWMMLAAAALVGITAATAGAYYVARTWVGEPAPDREHSAPDRRTETAPAAAFVDASLGAPDAGQDDGGVDAASADAGSDAASAGKPSEASEPRHDREPRARRRPPDPGELLERANELRAQRQWRRSERLYRRIVRRHEGTREANTARIAAAALRLEHLGDPEQALQLYRAALRAQPSGPLGAEARFGLAAAHRALGNDEAERRALKKFLEHHPQSLRTKQARARLKELP